MEFYSSISKKPFLKTIEDAQSVTIIEEKVTKTIYHACKSLLFDNSNAWVKNNPEFVMTMGSFDGAELCKSRLLDLLTK